MMEKPLAGRLIASVLVLAAAGAVCVSGARQARAQPKPMRIGTATAKAAHAEGNLNTGNYALSGNVTIQTPDGQSAAADTMLLVMGRNPVTKKDDVKAVTATGHVRFRTEQTIAQKDAPPVVRIVTGTADKVVWRRFEGTAVLTGNVTVSSEDAARKMTWRNAASATIDMPAGTVKADAASGEQMAVEMTSKQAPASQKTK